jgi:ADP-ribose pyrophosphatase YjhB (NUDIX family)
MSNLVRRSFHRSRSYYLSAVPCRLPIGVNPRIFSRSGSRSVSTFLKSPIDLFSCKGTRIRTMSTFTTNKEVSTPHNVLPDASEKREQEKPNPELVILPFDEDKYDGVIVNSLPDTATKFEEMLQSSLDHWRAAKRRGIWIKIPIEKSTFVPISVKYGFIFHHAEKDYVMMTHWLAEGESRLPPNASHQVGVGCVVIHEGKLLLVQEKNGPLRGSGIWKLPTGLVEVGEDLALAAEREVLEETGIHSKFEKLLAFRQAHNILFGKSDLFFLCVLTPTSFDINPQEVEIHDCKWKEPSSLLEQPFFKKSPLFTVLNDKIRHEIAVHNGEKTEQPSLVTKKLAIGFRPGENSLYYFESESQKN